MEILLQVLELVIVVPLALFGAALLVAGDRVRGPVPWLKFPRGWALRLIGAFYMTLGAFVSWQTVTLGIRWDAVLILYVVAAISVATIVRLPRRSA